MFWAFVSLFGVVGLVFAFWVTVAVWYISDQWVWPLW